MNTISLAPTLNWLRLPRDWYADPRLGLACDDVGPAAGAAWPLLLVRALLSGGRLTDRADLTNTLRCLDIGLSMPVAAEVATAFIKHGLVVEDGDGYVIVDVERYIPAGNAIPPQSRGAARALRDGSPGSRPESSPEVIEGGTDGPTDEAIDGPTELADHAAKNARHEADHRTAMPSSALSGPNDQPANWSQCSHSVSWKLWPSRVDERGVHIPAHLAGNHQNADGTWCTERPDLS